MSSDHPADANAGCFLCGRIGTRHLTGSVPQSATGEQIFQYECPNCGEYLIRTVQSRSRAEQAEQRFEDAGAPAKDGTVVELESAAAEHWSRELEIAERQRRSPKTPSEPRLQRNTSDSTACA